MFCFSCGKSFQSLPNFCDSCGKSLTFLKSMVEEEDIGGQNTASATASTVPSLAVLHYRQKNSEGKQTFSCHEEDPSKKEDKQVQVTPGVSPLTPVKPSSHNTVDLLPPENSSMRKTKQNLVRRISDADKATFVDDNKEKLIQRVSGVMAIVDQLGTMVHSETYSVIYSKRTSQDKMRTLFQRTFCSGGVKVKAAFYDILREDYPYLVTSLGGEL